LADSRDVYLFDESMVQEPPTRWMEMLTYCGPGFVLSASIVGSGELIATTTLGAKAGFVTLWVILLSCVVKVALQLQFGRHTIQSGEPALEAVNKLPGWRLGKAHWTIWLWFCLLPIKILQLGGIVGGLAILLNLIWPSLSIPLLVWLVAGVVGTLVSTGRYRFIERLSLAAMCAFTVLTLVSVAALQWTPYAIQWEQIATGLTFNLPPESLMFVFAAFGLTGVGGDEIMQYTYWLMEKGYAARVGPHRTGDPDWQRRAKGWTRVMVFDAIVSMVGYTIVTAAFYMLGAAVLHARNEIPEGYEMIATLARMYTESLGPWAKGVFLAGAFVVLFSTTFSALAAWTRIYTDTFSQLGWIRFEDRKVRDRTICALAWAFPLSWAVVFLWYEQPVIMVMLGGLATATILIIVVVAAVHFRYRRTLPGLEPSRMYDVAFWLSTVSITALAGYGIVSAGQKLSKWIVE